MLGYVLVRSTVESSIAAMREHSALIAATREMQQQKKRAQLMKELLKQEK
jgi:hypothetical protein